VIILDVKTMGNPVPPSPQKLDSHILGEVSASEDQENLPTDRGTPVLCRLFDSQDTAREYEFNAEVITLYRPLKPGQVMLTTQFRFPEDLVAEVKNDRFRFKMAVRLASSASSNSI